MKHEMREHVLDKICADLLNETENNNGKKKYGSISKIVKEMKMDFPWMNRDVVNNDGTIFFVKYFF